MYIERCWTIYDEDKMWDVNKYNTFTGKPIEKGIDLNEIVLIHGEGVFAEERVNDWIIVGGLFKYYSRVVSLGSECDIIIEFKKNEGK